jgi:hypothetical protein
MKCVPDLMIFTFSRDITPNIFVPFHQNNIEILPQHRIYPNNSPINLIPFPQEKPQRGMKGRNGWDL